jgi:hypothetical protein
LAAAAGRRQLHHRRLRGAAAPPRALEEHEGEEADRDEGKHDCNEIA